MLDKIIDLVRNNAGDAVVRNPSIPNEKNDSAIQAGGESIITTLKNALAGGKANDVLGYFKNGASGNQPIVNEATNNYSHELQSRFGMNEQEAGNVASKVIPTSMGQLAQRTADPNDNGFNIQDIFNQLTGGKAGGLDIQNLLSKFGGGNLDKDKDGDVDMKDIGSMFGGGGGIGGMFK